MAKGLPNWKELKPGIVIDEAGNACQYRTGDWRSQRPVWDHSRCIKCGICYIFCPDACVHQDAQGNYEADLFYCKGCGICTRECWTGGSLMEEEEE